MTIARYHQKPKPAPSSLPTAVIHPAISAGFPTSRNGRRAPASDRNYPPGSLKVAVREITAQLTPEEKAAILAAALTEFQNRPPDCQQR